MDANTFKKKWQKAKVLGDADALTDQMTNDEVMNLIKILREADDWVELDMKDKYLLNHCQTELGFRLKKAQAVTETAYGNRAVEKLEGAV